MNVKRRLLPLVGLTLLAISACGEPPNRGETQRQMVAEESARLNDWFADRDAEVLARSPIAQTYRGMRGLGDLDITTQTHLDEGAALTQAWAAEMRSEFDRGRLDAQTQISYDLFDYNAEDAAESHRWAGHTYVFNPMEGAHADLPAFLIGFQKIGTEAEAEAFISRLRQAGDYLQGYIDRAEDQAANGVLLPAFAYDGMMTAARNVVMGAPFTDEGVSPLLAHARAKIDRLEISPARKSELMAETEAALVSELAPAYRDIVQMFERHQAMTTEDDGVWKLPDGEAYYDARLKHYTTTELTADEIHQIGLAEVERIQGEMRDLQGEIGFGGSLREFFDDLRGSANQTYPNTEAGRARYIAEATAYIDEITARTDELFLSAPEAKIEVRRVEPFREATAFSAFYNAGADDGSRPGIYYVNMRDMADLPVYQMQALAYHEGVPGHHMQFAFAQEMADMPDFRRLGYITPYGEGWALYAEEIPKEIGLYTDPYQDFGRLSMEIFRAARLVVDTGIHAKKWTREAAVQYMMENTGYPEGDIRAEVDRYIVWPGQATGYMIGKLKFVELRDRARNALGPAFDLREYHDTVLSIGSVPLDILERVVDGWIKDKKETQDA